MRRQSAVAANEICSRQLPYALVRSVRCSWRRARPYQRRAMTLRSRRARRFSFPVIQRQSSAFASAALSSDIGIRLATITNSEKNDNAVGVADNDRLLRRRLGRLLFGVS